PLQLPDREPTGVRLQRHHLCERLQCCARAGGHFEGRPLQLSGIARPKARALSACLPAAVRGPPAPEERGCSSAGGFVLRGARLLTASAFSCSRRPKPSLIVSSSSKRCSSSPNASPRWIWRRAIDW